MLKKIKIEKLFNKFDYEIEFKKEGITILTGPNGYGKTTILKIIYAFAEKNLIFFFNLPFKKISLFHNDTIIITQINHELIEVSINGNNPVEIAKDSIISRKMRRILENSPFRQVDENHWVDRRSGKVISVDELLTQVGSDIQIAPKIQLPEFVKVYLIKEQRLIRKIPINRRNMSYYYEEDGNESYKSTIDEYSKDLSKNIKDVLANASRVGQELDSSFPRRLFEETQQVSEDDFDERYNIIKEKQKSLNMYGLSATKEDSHTSYSSENAKALLVYLNDTEKKLKVFDEILQKLNIFSTILNERGFVNKQLKISPEIGFEFITDDGSSLSLTDLSSGEQQEVVLLYELLFRVDQNTLVLIDEPEISLHVAWQKEVLNDLLKIIELQKISVITATHSPQIIGNHWDLVLDLNEISK